MPPRMLRLSVPTLVLPPDVKDPFPWKAPETVPPPTTGPEKLPMTVPGPPPAGVRTLAVPCKDPEHGEQTGKGAGLKPTAPVLSIWKSKLPPRAPGEAKPEPLAENEETEKNPEKVAVVTSPPGFERGIMTPVREGGGAP